MSEPLTSHEIEDVLSSIRRLVSEDLRPAARAAGLATGLSAPAPAAAAAAPDAGAEAGKLLLTPALRVVPEAPPMPEANPVAEAHPVAEAVHAVEEVQAMAAPAGPEIAAPEAHPLPAPAEEVYDDLGLDEGDDGLKALLDTVTLDEAWIAAPALPETPEDSPETAAEEDELIWSAPGDDVAEGEMTEDLVPAGASALAEAYGHWTAQDVPGMDWAQEETDWVEPEPIPFVAHPRKPGLAADPLARAWADRAEAEAEVKASLHGAARPASTGADPEPQARPEAAAAGAAPGPFDGDDVEIDEEMLREIVRDIIRGELAGTLGKRITRNVRKLVRVEINRALTAREFE